MTDKPAPTEMDPQAPPPTLPEAPNTHASEIQAAIARLPRRAVLGAAAIAVIGAGVATALLRDKPSAAPAVTDAIPGFWELKWNTPAGAELPMQSFKGRPLLINFWATWCPPCIEEMPLINAFFKQNRANGWQVLGLAVDKPTMVQTFLGTMPLAFPVAMAGFNGTELSRSLGNLTGSLPFSIALDAAGGIIQRKMGRLDADDLRLLGGLK